MAHRVRLWMSVCCAGVFGLAACAGDANDAATQAACQDVLAELTMPFPYELGDQGVRIRGVDGRTHHLVFGPWGAHNSPHTGHPAGNAKADMMAVLANGAEDMTSVEGGPCAAFDENAPNCGLEVDDVLAGRPYYILPDGFSEATRAKMKELGLGYEITAVFVKRQGVVGSEDWFYGDSPDQWEVNAHICGYTFTFGHVGSLAPPLREALVERGVAVDFDAYDGPLDENLVVGEPIRTLEPGTAVAYPQIVGSPSSTGSAHITPHEGSPVLWAQIEFGGVRYDGDTGYIARCYDLLDADELERWEAALHAEMADPASARYGTPLGRSREWLWRAEGRLLHTPEFTPEDTRHGLLRRLGDWWESTEGCGEADSRCDEVIAFNRIDRDSAAFRAELFDARSQAIVWWLRTGATPGDGYYGEILATDGDLLSDTTGQLLVRWRTFDDGLPIDGALGTHAHQWLSWRRGPGDTLKLARGVSAPLEDDAARAPVPDDSTPCDGETVTCSTGFNENVRPGNIDGQL